MKSTTNNSQKVKKLTIIALFCAMSFIVSIILPIKVMFLTLDFKDTISTICGMFFGPVSGLVCATIVPFLEYFTTGSATREYGLIMNLLSSITFVGVSTLIYKYKKTIWGAIIGLVTAVFATVAVMLVANLYITPFYMGVTQYVFVDLIPKLILPFNLVKTILNAGITMLIYKPVSKVLKRMGLAKSNSSVKDANTVVNSASKTRSLIVTVVSAIIIVIAFLILFLVLGGKIS